MRASALALCAAVLLAAAHEHAAPAEDFAGANPEMQAVVAIADCFYNSTEGREGVRASHLRVSYVEPENYVSLFNILDELDVAQLEAFALCVVQHEPGRHRIRLLQGASTVSTTIDIHGYLQAVIPELVSYILAVTGIAADEAGWRPHPYHMGVRAAEIIQYETDQNDRWHTDDNSMYTLTITLSNTTAVDGGADHIKAMQASDEFIAMPDAQFDGYLAYTLAPRATAAMPAGTRRVLSIEFWPYEDAPLAAFRPSVADAPPLRQPTFFSVRNAYDAPDEFYFVHESGGDGPGSSDGAAEAEAEAGAEAGAGEAETDSGSPGDAAKGEPVVGRTEL